jgi:hypothetical protein
MFMLEKSFDHIIPIVMKSQLKLGVPFGLVLAALTVDNEI